MPHPPHTHSHSQILPQESLFHKPEFHSPLTPITKLSSEKGKLSSISPSWDHTPIEWKKKTHQALELVMGSNLSSAHTTFMILGKVSTPSTSFSQGQEGRNQSREISPALRKPLILCTSFQIQLSPNSSMRASRLLQLFYEVIHGGCFTNLNSELLEDRDQVLYTCFKLLGGRCARHIH